MAENVAPEGFEPVPSFAVSSAMLAEWGFPVRKVEKSMGEVMVVAEGAKFGAALWAAWAAGFVRLASEPAERRAEGFAWALECAALLADLKAAAAA
jgi:hypothetical protein